MFPTRRSFTQALLVGSVLAPLLRPREATAQIAAAPDLRMRLLQARESANPRARIAAEKTLARLDELAIDFAAPRLILVNIAATEVIAFENGREVMRSKVIVGTGRTRTPQLLTFVTSVRTNPPWHVPHSIFAEIRASGAAGFQAVGGRLIQPPGPNNPLGPLRLGLLDSDGIFLHGTNRPGLFERQARNLSHGCVRVERIRELCAWVLDVPPAEVNAAVATRRTMELHPMQEVQVVLAYLTAWPDMTGQMVVHPDPYGLDAPGTRIARHRRVMRGAPDDPIEVEEAARSTIEAASRL